MFNKQSLIYNTALDYDILLLSDEYIPARSLYTASVTSRDDPSGIADSVFGTEQYLRGYSNAITIGSSDILVYLGCVDKVPYWIDSHSGEKISLEALCSTKNLGFNDYQWTAALSSAVTNDFNLSIRVCNEDASTVMYENFVIHAESKMGTIMVKNAFSPLRKLHVKFSPSPDGYYDGFYTTYVRTVDSNGNALAGAVYDVRYEENTSPEKPIVHYFDKPRKQYILVTNRLPKYIDFVAAPDGYNKPLRPIELDQETRKCEVVYNAGTLLPPLPTSKKLILKHIVSLI